MGKKKNKRKEKKNTNPTTPGNASTAEHVDKEKKPSFTQYALAASTLFGSRKQGGRITIISPWDVKQLLRSLVSGYWQDAARFPSHICPGTDRQTDRPPQG